MLIVMCKRDQQVQEIADLNPVQREKNILDPGLLEIGQNALLLVVGDGVVAVYLALRLLAMKPENQRCLINAMKNYVHHSQIILGRYLHGLTVLYRVAGEFNAAKSGVKTCFPVVNKTISSAQRLSLANKEIVKCLHADLIITTKHHQHQ